MIELLETRGLSISAESRIRFTRFLLDTNYYRASGYWRYFQSAPQFGDNQFRPNTTAEQILDLYEFDAALRTLLLEGLATVEITLRSRFAYYYSQHLGEFSYLVSETYGNLPKESAINAELGIQKLVKQIEEDLAQSKERYIKRFRDANQEIPVWVAIEALSMGTVSKMYSRIRNAEVRYAVAKSFGIPNPEFAMSIFRSLTVLRNHCAHHARIWNRVPEFPPPVLNILKTESDKDVYHRTSWAWIVTLAKLADEINRNTHYSEDLFDFIDSFPEFHEGLKYPHSR